RSEPFLRAVARSVLLDAMMPSLIESWSTAGIAPPKAPAAPGEPADAPDAPAATQPPPAPEIAPAAPPAPENAPLHFAQIDQTAAASLRELGQTLEAEAQGENLSSPKSGSAKGEDDGREERLPEAAAASPPVDRARTLRVALPSWRRSPGNVSR